MRPAAAPARQPCDEQDAVPQVRQPSRHRRPGADVPLGIGAAIGASANWVAVRTLARNADEFFARLPYSAIEVDAIDVTERRVATWEGPAQR